MNAIGRIVAIVIIGLAVFGLATIARDLVPDTPEPPRLPAPAVGSGVQAEPGTTCRSVDEGYLETNPTFGHADATHTHANYWSADEPERDVLLGAGFWQRPPGFGGYFWSYAGCSEGFVRAQIDRHQEEQKRKGVNNAGDGDPELFTPAP